MAVGGAIAAGSIAAGMISSRSASKAARQAAAQAAAESGRQFDVSMQEMREAAEYLESIGIPPIEAQRIALEQAELGPSAMEDIETDPRLRSAQMDALASLQKAGEPGLGAEERAQEMMITRGAGAQAQARDKAVLQQMAERGIGGSGAELIARLQGSQGAADRAAMQQAQLSGQAESRALQAMTQAGQLGGQIRGQEYGEQTQLASARDRIAQFNEMQRTQARQQEEIHNKALIQRQFENVMSKRQAVAAARTGTAQAGVQRAGQIQAAGTARAAGELQAGAAKTQLYGQLGAAGIQAATAADGGVIGTAEYGYQEGGMVLPEEEEQMVQQGPLSQAPNNNAGFDAGGVMSQGYEGGHRFAGGGTPVPDSGMADENRYLEGDIVPGDSFEGDRVDAKINSGEMVLNIEQQQRLMELLRGLRDLQGLGDEDIIETPGAEGQLPPAGLPAAIPDGQEVPFAHGGMVPSEYKTPTEAKPRGVHSEMKYEKDMEEKSTNESKARKARIKAYETLANGGR